MRVITLFAAVVVAGAIAAGYAMSSGGPPPPEPPAPQPGTVVAHGEGDARVAEPEKRTNRSIRRNVAAARKLAIPRAVAAARTEAAELAQAAGLSLGDAVAIARDVAPMGWYGEDTGRFGPGRWCGRAPLWRTVVRDDGERVRVRRMRRTCHKPARTSVRVTLTLAAKR